MTVDTTTQARIDRFLAEKTRQHPDLSKKSHKINVRQRGRFFDEVAYFFGV